MAYIYDGGLEVGARQAGERHLLLFTDGERLALRGGASGAGFLLLRGRPIRERVVHYGPFVMNSEAEIEQAIRDYQSGRFAA
jgi:redox-sensitive bicupin YhaK (pirin superfamily)